METLKGVAVLHDDFRVQKANFFATILSPNVTLPMTGTTLSHNLKMVRKSEFPM